MKLVLASASPRRRDLLAGLGVPFEVRPSRTDEGSPVEISPAGAAAAAVRLARSKARDVAATEVLGEPALVVGADTLVVLPDRVLGKPSSVDSARDMLRALAGRDHLVVTGVVVIRTPSGTAAEGAEETRVFFRDLSEEVISAYLATGEPFDKAGAYAVQGVGSLLVRRIEGCYFNVVGLPVGLLAELLGRLGGNLLAEAAAAAAGRDGGGTRQDA